MNKYFSRFSDLTVDELWVCIFDTKLKVGISFTVQQQDGSLFQAARCQKLSELNALDRADKRNWIPCSRQDAISILGKEHFKKAVKIVKDYEPRINFD